MKIVFAHQNFPGQFGAFARYLADAGCEVWFFTAKESTPEIPGIRIVRMTPHRDPAPGVHRYAGALEKAAINGQAFANAAVSARKKGLNPDVVIAHSGWGSGTFAKAVWPECRYVPYVEWYYSWPPVDDVSVEPAQSMEDGRALSMGRNAPTLLDLAAADLAFCPTEFQARQFPAHLRGRIEVLHDGVDAKALAPKPGLRPEGLGAPEDAEWISYATRGMEPHRGFPEFMRALATLQKRRPTLHAIIGGEDRVAYGRRLPEGESWKARMLAECDLDGSRLHFTGPVSRSAYTRMLQATDLHVYLTVPFVLSWSLIEAMSAGAPIVASDVEPVREALRHGVEAELVDHRDPQALAAAMARLLDDRARARALGAAARARVLRDYDDAWIHPARLQRLDRLVRFGPRG